MPYPRLTAREIAERGEDLYAKRIRDTVEAENKGRFVVIDVDTGDYEVGDDYLELSHRLQAKRSDALLYTIRIGFPVVGSIGSGGMGVRV